MLKISSRLAQVGSGSGFSKLELSDPNPVGNGPDPQPCSSNINGCYNALNLKKEINLSYFSIRCLGRAILKLELKGQQHEIFELCFLCINMQRLIRRTLNVVFTIVLLPSIDVTQPLTCSVSVPSILEYSQSTSNRRHLLYCTLRYRCTRECV